MRANLGYEVAAEPAPEPGLLQQWQTDFGEATRLSTQQRFAGFGACVVFTAVFWGLVRLCQALQWIMSEPDNKGHTRSSHAGLIFIDWCKIVRFSCDLWLQSLINTSFVGTVAPGKANLRKLALCMSTVHLTPLQGKLHIYVYLG